MAASDRLADFLFGRRSARRSILAVLFAQPAARIHLRELARRTGFSAPMVAKELDRLLSQNVALEYREGNTRAFQANMRSPLAEDLRRIAVPASTVKQRRRGARETVAAAEEASHRRPCSLKEAADWGVALGRRDAFLREFLDEFYVASPTRRAKTLADEPPLDPGDDRANAYYAAVAEHLALSYGLEVPPWARARSRFLRRPWFPAGLESLKSTLLVESPPAFRRRMIFVGADPLARPRRKSPPARPPAP